MKIRVGNGYDVHAFAPKGEENDFITIGGIPIAYSRKLLAHSDGDVLIHALCDAMLGALALGDIGSHFPDTAAAYADIDSRELLRKVKTMIQVKGWQLINADVTLVAQEPRFAPHIQAMRAQLSECLACGTEQISIKATTTEKLGFAGRKEGIACYAVCLLSADE